MEIVKIEKLMKSELEKIRKMEIKNILVHKMDYMLLKLIYDSSADHPASYSEKINKCFPSAKKYNSLNQLKRMWLDNPSKREDFNQNLDRASSLIYNLCFQSSEDTAHDVEKYQEIKETIFSKKSAGSTSKAIMNIFIDKMRKGRKISADLLNELEEVVSIANFRQCKILLERIVDKISVMNGLNKENKKELTILKGLKKTSTVENITNYIDRNECPKELDGLIYELIEEYEDLRTTLVAVDQDYEDLRRDLADKEGNLANDAIVNFFRELNSVKYNNFIDNLYKIHHTMKNNDDESSYKNIIRQVSMLLSIFMKVLKRSNVDIIETIGNKKNIECKDIDKYDYIGSEYADKSSKKFVEVMKPGWKCNDVVITKPQVREIEEE